MPEVAYAKVVFLNAQSGGRTNPVIGQSCKYRPHIRVGGDGNYLGVCFISGPDLIPLGVESDVTLVLVYFPEVDYSALMPGTRFQILEGAQIVGNGFVIGRGSVCGRDSV